MIDMVATTVSITIFTFYPFTNFSSLKLDEKGIKRHRLRIENIPSVLVPSKKNRKIFFSVWSGGRLFITAKLNNLVVEIVKIIKLVLIFRVNEEQIVTV